VSRTCTGFVNWLKRCGANVAHIRQSRTDSNVAHVRQSRLDSNVAHIRQSRPDSNVAHTRQSEQMWHIHDSQGQILAMAFR